MMLFNCSFWSKALVIRLVMLVKAGQSNFKADCEWAAEERYANGI